MPASERCWLGGGLEYKKSVRGRAAPPEGSRAERSALKCAASSQPSESGGEPSAGQSQSAGEAASPAPVPRLGGGSPVHRVRAHPLLAHHTPLRRFVLVAVTFYLGFNTPAGAFQRSLFLGAFAVVCLYQRELMARLSEHLALPPPALAAVQPVNGSAAAPGGAGAEGLPSWLRGMTGAQQTAFGVFVYLLAGLCEIGGGWLVWQAVRSGKPWYWALGGSAVLVCYGFVATLQPVAAFARVYASAAHSANLSRRGFFCLPARNGRSANANAHSCPASCSLRWLLHHPQRPVGEPSCRCCCCPPQCNLLLMPEKSGTALARAQGMALDGFKPDVGDLVGGALIIAGIATMTAWRR